MAAIAFSSRNDILYLSVVICCCVYLKDGDDSGTSVFTPVLNSRLVNISMDAVFTDLHRYIQTTVQVI